MMLKRGDTLKNKTYTIVEYLAEGGFGITYQAHYTNDPNQWVAINNHYS